MSDNRNTQDRQDQARQTHPSAADQFQNISSTMGKPESDEAFNSKEEGSTQIRQTVESLKQKIKDALGMSR